MKGKQGAGAKSELAAFLETVFAKEKKIAKQLRPAASAEALVTLRGLEAPALLSELYAAHDGSEEEIYGPYRLLSVDEIVAERATMNGLLEQNPRWKKDGTWDARFLPFMADGDGQLYVVDVAGVCDGGAAGQVLFYDHEVGPERACGSLAVFLGMLTTAAKKKLLSLEAWDERGDELDDLRADARSAGLPKMNKKERAALEAKLEGGEDEDRPSAEDRLALLAPLRAKYGAEEAVWLAITEAATELQRWPLVIEAATTGIRLASKDSKNSYARELFAALVHMGRPEDGLVAFRAAVERASNINQYRVGLIPSGLPSEVRRRALEIITEVQPRDIEPFFLLGSEATDEAERKAYLEQVIAKVAGESHPGTSWQDMARSAKRILEHARIASFAPKDRVEALVAFAEATDEGTAAGLWADAAAAALETGDLATADLATAKQIEHTYDFQRYELCELRLRVLHALGRDAEALAVLDEALEHTYCGTDACFAAIPWNEERKAGALTREPARDAFLAACFAKVTDRAEENLEAWKWRRTFAAGEERTKVLRHLVAFCTEQATRKDEDGGLYWGEDGAAEHRKLAEACRAELGA